MGDLIVMTRPTGLSRRPPADASADILFFTGVRYVRLDSVDLASPAAEQPRRRRSDKAKKSNQIQRATVVV